MREDIIESISFLSISPNRTKIVKYMGDDINTPSQISKATGMRINHVSRALKELKQKELVVCLNENKKIGRLYILTDKGKEVIKYI